MLDTLQSRKLPPLMAFKDGTPVKTPDDWRKRRRELLTMLQHEEYGVTPRPRGLFLARFLKNGCSLGKKPRGR